MFENYACRPRPRQEVFAVAKAIKAAGKSVDIHIYPGVDHAFFNDERKDVYDKAAAEDAWRRTLSFFRQHLR